MKILLMAALLSHCQALTCATAILDPFPAPAATQMFFVVLTGIVSDKSLGVILDERLKLPLATHAGSESSDRSSAAHLSGHVEAKTTVKMESLTSLRRAVVSRRDSPVAYYKHTTSNKYII